MTKTILLVGGPRDGKIDTVPKALQRFTILREIAPGKKMVLLGFERGYYTATGREEQDKEIFEWQGWEGEQN